METSKAAFGASSYGPFFWLQEEWSGIMFSDLRVVCCCGGFLEVCGGEWFLKVLSYKVLS